MNKLFSPLGLTLLAILALLPGIWSLPLLDPYEAQAAHDTVVEMGHSSWSDNSTLSSENTLLQALPPLSHWWMDLSFKLFGIYEYSARIHSALSSWALALLLFDFARKLGLTNKLAFLAGAGWLTTIQVFAQSRLALPDMPFVLFATLALLVIYKLLTSQGSLIQLALLTLWLH